MRSGSFGAIKLFVYLPSFFLFFCSLYILPYLFTFLLVYFLTYLLLPAWARSVTGLTYVTGKSRKNTVHTLKIEQYNLIVSLTILL